MRLLLEPRTVQAQTRGALGQPARRDLAYRSPCKRGDFTPAQGRRGRGRGGPCARERWGRLAPPCASPAIRPRRSRSVKIKVRDRTVLWVNSPKTRGGNTAVVHRRCATSRDLSAAA